MRPRLIVVGASLGGFWALKEILAGLPGEYAVPMVIAQHRASDAESALGMLWQRYSARPVKEPEDKERIMGGYVYVAPADYHLLVEGDSFALSTEAPVAYARPSIDVLFESAAEAYGPGVVGIILTGMNSDGAAGLAAIKERGGYTIVQDPQSAERGALPAAALATIRPDRCLHLAEIAPALIDLGVEVRR